MRTTPFLAAVSVALPTLSSAQQPASTASPAAPTLKREIHTIAVGQSVNGTLSDQDPLYSDSTYFQRWQFQTTPRQDVTIDLSSPDFRPVLILRGLDSTVANLNGGPGCAARISLNFPESGPYVVLVNTSSTPLRQTGRFTLVLTAGREPVAIHSGHCPPGGNGSVHPIAVGQTVVGEITAADDRYTDTTYYQRWRFTADPGQDLTIDLASPDFDPVMLFYGLDTVMVDDDGGPGCASRIAFTAPTSGPYTVLVNTTSTPHEQTGRFTLSLSPGKKRLDPAEAHNCRPPELGHGGEGPQESKGSTHTIAVGEMMAGLITTNDELWQDSTYVQRWKIGGRAGQIVTIDLESSDFDAYLMLSGPGVTRDNDADDDSGGKCNARLVVKFPESATYEIDVNTQGHKFATGAFTLSVTDGAKSKSDTPCHPPS